MTLLAQLSGNVSLLAGELAQVNMGTKGADNSQYPEKTTLHLLNSPGSIISTLNLNTVNLAKNNSRSPPLK